MRRGRTVSALARALGVVATAACDPQHAVAPIDRASEPGSEVALGPLPEAPKVDTARAALGGSLFADPTLSSDGSVSCATCHPLESAGADGLSHSRGARGQATTLNTPTIYNVIYDFRFSWNGAYATLEDSLDPAVTKAMGTTWNAIDERIRSSPMRVSAFKSIYADGVTTASVKDAIVRYLETLVTPDARFDQYLRGDVDALTAEERHGYETFNELGCVNCHQGANVGGNLFQRFGVMADYFGDRIEHGGPPLTAADDGRYNTTKNPADRHVFRVPSLRNVARTPPYFHDGTAATLEQAVTTMARTQLGRELTQDQESSIVAFLGTLSGAMAGAPP